MVAFWKKRDGETKPRTKKRKWLKQLILAIVLIAIVFVFLMQTQNKGISYTTEKAARGTVASTLVENGNIVAASQADIFSTSTGTVQELFVKNGDKVKQGAKLFSVTSSATEQEKASAYSNYLSAVNSQKKSEQDQKTLQALVEKDKASVYTAQNDVDYKNGHTTNPKTNEDYTTLEKQAIDSALTSANLTLQADQKKLNDATTSINAAKAQVNSTWLAYQETQSAVITSPVDGMVGNLSIAVGSKVSAQGASGGDTASTAMIVGNLDSLQVKLTLNEVDVTKVKMDLSATITASAVKDKSFAGKIISIDGFGTNDAGVVTYNVYLSLAAPDPSLKSQMTVTVTLETAKHENVVTVSNSAVKAYQGSKAVEVIVDSSEASPPGGSQKTKMVPVKIGIKDANRTEILEGISEGTEVVTGTTDNASQPTP